jgi:hypothetical protein
MELQPHQNAKFTTVVAVQPPKPQMLISSLNHNQGKIDSVDFATTPAN